MRVKNKKNNNLNIFKSSFYRFIYLRDSRVISLNFNLFLSCGKLVKKNFFLNICLIFFNKFGIILVDLKLGALLFVKPPKYNIK